MTRRLLAAGARLPLEPAASGSYRPGVCNIGSAEIARRRRTGVTMTIATLALLAVLIAVGAPPPLRILVFFPAAVAASGFLQAWLRFCAGFGWLGVFNFDDLGSSETVADADARSRDRATAIQIAVASGIVGVAVAVAALLLTI